MENKNFEKNMEILTKEEHQILNSKTICCIGIQQFSDINFNKHSQINIYGQRACGKTYLSKKIAHQLVQRYKLQMNIHIKIMIEDMENDNEGEYEGGILCTNENLDQHKFENKIL